MLLNKYRGQAGIIFTWEKGKRTVIEITYVCAAAVHCCVFYMLHLIVNWLTKKDLQHLLLVQHTVLICLCSETDVSSLCCFSKRHASDSSGFSPEWPICIFSCGLSIRLCPSSMNCSRAAVLPVA